MIESGVVVSGSDVLYWHTPEMCTSVSIPDSRELWDVLWEHRKSPAIGFAHTHPGDGIPCPSITDLTTFAAIERGLGRRLLWWIVSSDCIVEIHWEGPNQYDYKSTEVNETWWAMPLRMASKSLMV